MKICNIDSYLLMQMVNIFPILFFSTHLLQKKKRKKKTTGEHFLKLEDKKGECCFKNTVHIYKYILKINTSFSSLVGKMSILLNL